MSRPRKDTRRSTRQTVPPGVPASRAVPVNDGGMLLKSRFPNVTLANSLMAYRGTCFSIVSKEIACSG